MPVCVPFLDRGRPRTVRRRGPARLGTLVALLLAVLLAVVGFGREPDAIEFPQELVAWEPLVPSPVFTAGGAGQWDVKIRERGWILREGDLWRMWYTGYDGTRPGLKQLGYATSPDGLTWERWPANPIYAEHWVEDMQVVRQGDHYYMFSEGRNDQAQLLRSTDGVAWTRLGTLDVRRANGEPIAAGPYGTPTAWLENGTWYLFYERMDQGIWLATSRDLQVWTNASDEPLLVPGPGAYDDRMVALNQIVKRGEVYFAYYHGSGSEEPGRWCTAIAASRDLKRWEKFAGNPLLRDNKSSGILVGEGPEARLYTMHDQVWVHVPRAAESRP